jgi:hypothetical protein
VFYVGRQTFSFWYFVPSWKVWRVWFICWNLALFGSCYLISYLLPYLHKWDMSLSMCVLFHSLCSLVFALFTCWTLESTLCYLDSLIYFGQPFIVSHLCVHYWFIWCFVKNISPFGSWKSCACIFTTCIWYGMLYFLWSDI